MGVCVGVLMEKLQHVGKITGVTQDRRGDKRMTNWVSGETSH